MKTGIGGACPQCLQVGKPIDTGTVKSLLARSLIEVTAAHYSFCATATCSVVYFAVETDHTFTTADVREAVYQKAPNDPAVFVCYCFRHTVGQIDAAIQQVNPQRVVTAITAGIQAGCCACDVRNPQGTCCLGNVRARFQNGFAAN